MPLQLKCQDGPIGATQDSHRNVKTQLARPISGEEERKRVGESSAGIKRIFYNPVMSVAESKLSQVCCRI